MANLTVERMTPFVGRLPAKGTYGAAASVKILKGQIVCQDVNGRAAQPIPSGTAGTNACGVSPATQDNSTGANDAISVEVEFGVFEFQFVQVPPKPQAKLFVVDNQTVSGTQTDGVALRGFAGVCVSVDLAASTCRVFISPLNGLL